MSKEQRKHKKKDALHEQSHHKSQWKQVCKSSSLVPLLRTIFLVFWLPKWNLLKKYSHVISFYLFIYFCNMSSQMSTIFFFTQKIIFVCVKKFIFYFFRSKEFKEFASTNHPKQNQKKKREREKKKRHLLFIIIHTKL